MIVIKALLKKCRFKQPCSAVSNFVTSNEIPSDYRYIFR